MNRVREDQGPVTFTVRRVAPADRLFLTAALACVVGWSVVLVLVGLIREFGGIAAVVPSGFAIVGGLYSYGLIAIAVYAGSQRKGWKYGRFARILCACVSAAAAMAIQNGADSGGTRELIGRLASAAVVAISVIVIVGEARSRPMSPGSCLAAGVLPSLLLAIGAAVQPGILEFTRAFSPNAAVDADPVISNFVVPLALAAPAYVLLGTAAWALFTVRVGLAASRPVVASTVVVAGVLAVKLAWVALSIADVLPHWLQGRQQTWDAVRADGRWSWLLASVLAAVVIAGLIVLDRTAGRRSRRTKGRAKRRAERRAKRQADRRAQRHEEHGPLVTRVLDRLESHDSSMTAGLDRAERVVQAVIWTLAAPALVISLLGIVSALWFGAGVSPEVPVAGALLAGSVLVARAALEPRWRYAACALLAVAAVILLLVPLGAHYGSAWWVRIVTSVQQNYVYLPGLLGFVALAVTIVLAYRLWTAKRHRGRVWNRRSLSTVAAALWTAVLLPVSLFFFLPLLSSFPLVYPRTGSFHVFNLLPTREEMRGISIMLGDPAPERAQPGWAGPGGTFEWTTFDAVLTLGLVLFLVLTARGPLLRSRYANPMVLMVCLTSTLVAHSATVSPVSWGRGGWLYLAMVFPAGYELLFNSRQASRRPGSLFALVVLSAIALTTLGVMAVTTRSFLSDAYPLDATVYGYARNFGAQFFVYPMAATYLVLALVHWRRTRHEVIAPGPAAS